MNRTLAAVVLMFTGMLSYAADLQVPKLVTAGTAFSIPTSGRGSAAFYLVGPSHSAKRPVKLGSSIEVGEEEVRSAGRYIATVCSDSCTSSDFFVVATTPANLSLLVHPSRVRVATNQAMSAVAFVFDKFHNPVLLPVPVDFHISVKDAQASSKSVTASDGVAWMYLNSTRKEGPAQVAASIAGVSEKRVVQQVASDACNLRIRAERKGKFIAVETDPVRDCSGNSLPDGTVVTFTKVDSAGKTTVDAPVKRGVAKIDMPAAGEATISVAAGVAMGNEVRVGGTP